MDKTAGIIETVGLAFICIILISNAIMAIIDTINEHKLKKNKDAISNKKNFKK